MTYTTEHSLEYKRALASKHWKHLRAIALSSSGGRCEGCKAHESETPLELHHKTYERLGRELWTDVELLCPDCHVRADALRQYQTTAKNAAARRFAAIKTYAIKKYGEDLYCVDWDELANEFEHWLERKQMERDGY